MYLERNVFMSESERYAVITIWEIDDVTAGDSVGVCQRICDRLPGTVVIFNKIDQQLCVSIEVSAMSTTEASTNGVVQAVLVLTEILDYMPPIPIEVMVELIEKIPPAQDRIALLKQVAGFADTYSPAPSS